MGIRPHDDNGMRLASFALQYGMVIGGTLFPHKTIHKGTWISPDGNTVNQIDHALVRKKFRKSLLDTRVYRNGDCDTDHLLLVIKIRMKLLSKKHRVTKSKKINIGKLKEPEIREQYQVAVENRFSVLDDENADISWDEVCAAALEVGEEILGIVERGRRNEWFDEECMRAAERRKAGRMKWLEDRENERKREDFRQARRIAVAINRRKKRQAQTKTQMK